MTEWLGPEWAEQAGALFDRLPTAGGANGTVCLAVATAPRREVAIHWRYEDGRAVSGASGVAADADLSLSMAAADAREVFSGRVEPSVAFMRGRLKASGDGALLLSFLRSTAEPSFVAWREAVAGVAAVPG